MKWLVPRMASFRAMHPEVDLQLQASDDVVDLRSHAVDIAVRYGRGPYPGLVAEPCSATALRPWPIPGWACWVRPTWPACR